MMGKFCSVANNSLLRESAEQTIYKLLIFSRIIRYCFPDFSCCWSAVPGRYRGPPQWRPRRKRTRPTLEQQKRAEEDVLKGGASQVTPERFPNEV
jgi:hypothetical protein